MALLGAINYDPASAVTKACTARLAMTAFDTTNLRITFTAPANGIVMVRMCGVELGATTLPSILFGILESATVKGRVVPIGAIAGTTLATTYVTQEAVFLVSGLISGNSYTWDASYGVEILATSCNIKYGGPDNNSGANAWGGFQFEIWSVPACLGAILYDPGTASTKSTASLTAMTAIDTANLRITFTAPSSGKVLCRLGGCVHGATTFPQILFGVLDGSTVRGRVPALGGLCQTALATSRLAAKGEFVVSGLTGGTSYSFDAAYAVQTAVTSSAIKFGGPNDTTTDNAWGAFQFSIHGL